MPRRANTASVSSRDPELDSVFRVRVGRLAPLADHLSVASSCCPELAFRVVCRFLVLSSRLVCFELPSMFYCINTFLCLDLAIDHGHP